MYGGMLLLDHPLFCARNQCCVSLHNSYPNDADTTETTQTVPPTSFPGSSRFSRTAAILKNEKILGTRLGKHQLISD